MNLLNTVIVLQLVVWCAYGQRLTLFKSASTDVRAIIEDEYVPGSKSLVYISGHSILTFPKTNYGSRKDLLSGDYRTSGYQSGSSRYARWRYPSDVVFIDNQTMVITDRENHCLRTLSRRTNRTSHFAGTGEKSGYLDGTISKALFSSPTGLVKHGRSLFIADTGNNAVREINGNIILTHAHATIKSPLYLDIDPSEQFIYFTTSEGVYRSELYGHKTELITGLDFGSTSKKFSSLKGIKVLNDGVLLVTDVVLDRILIVDTYFGKVEYICSGISGDASGSYSTCKLSNPQSLLLTQDMLYVGSDGYISRSEKQDVIDQVFPHIERCPQQADIILRLPRGQSTLQYTWTHPQASSTQPRKPVTCTVCPPNTQMLSEGVHHIRYVFSNKYYNTTCQFTIRVLKHAERDSGAHTGALLSEDMVCPKDYKVYLTPGMLTATTEWQKPSYPRVVKCIDCPLNKARLSAGRHKFTYKYLDIQSSTKYYCSFNIDVLREGTNGSQNISGAGCTNKTKIVPLRSGSNKAMVKLPVDASGVQRSIKLPAGTYNFTVRLPNNETCTETYKVMVAVENPKIFVDYAVKYKVGCSKLSSLELTVVDSFLQQHTPHINNLCGCKSMNRTRSCDLNDNLLVKWRTNQAYPGSTEIPGIVAAIKRYQENVIKVSGTFMQITVINRNPPIVPAAVDSNGVVVRLSKRYECSDGKIYQPITQICA